MQFHPFVNLELRHTYYTDGLDQTLQLRPTSATQQWLQQTGFRFIQQGTTGRLLGQLPENGLFSALDLPEGMLCFDGLSTDPAFVNFTEMPLAELGKLVFTATTTPPTDASISLPAQFEVSSTPGQAVATIQVPLATLSARQDSLPLNYAVQFHARKVSWCYYIIGNLTSEQTLILQGVDHALFAGPTAVQLTNGTNALAFNSQENLIALSTAGRLDLSLATTEADGSISLLLEQLPSANPASLQLSNTDNNEQRLSAAIYIYL